MNIKNLEKAVRLNSIINQANEQIEKFKTIKDKNEIIILVNSDKISEMIKNSGIIYDDKETFQPLYLTGEYKDTIMDVLIHRKEKFKAIHLDEVKRL